MIGIHCQTDMKKDKAPYHIDRKGYHFFFYLIFSNLFCKYHTS